MRLLVVLTTCLSFVVTACSGLGGGTSPSPTTTTVAPPASGAAISYTAIGASDAIGIGASIECPLLSPCDNGTGYVPRIARTLRTQSHAVTLLNLGIPAAVLSPTIYQLARSRGRDIPANFFDHELPLLPQTATLVTIFGGGNDANALGFAIQQGAAGSTDLATYIDGQVRAYGSDFDRLTQRIRAWAASAYVVVLNLPNLASLPYSAGYTLRERQALQRIAVGFSREANRQAGPGVVVIDLMCDPAVYDRSRIAADGFHPNDAGYAYLEQRVLAALSGGVAAPQASCAQMQAVPSL